jgi:hypothetical protein
MAATVLTLEVSREAEELVVSAEAGEMNALAYKLWQRGSCAKQALEEDWVTPEECILIPH